jgi:hypothetical protein
MASLARLLVAGGSVELSDDRLTIRRWLGDRRDISIQSIGSILFCSVTSRRNPRAAPVVAVLDPGGRCVGRIPAEFYAEADLRDLLSRTGPRIDGSWATVLEAEHVEREHPGVANWRQKNPGAYGIFFVVGLLAVGFAILSQLRP